MRATKVVVMLLMAAAMAAATPTPVVLWHGMGDDCCDPQSMGYIEDVIKKAIPGVYVHSIMIGANPTDDRIDSFLGSVWDQVDFVCGSLAGISELQGGFNFMTFSQGGQFARAVVEKCGDTLNVRNLITWGGQHMGVGSLPNCVAINDTICDIIDDVLDDGVYSTLAQKYVIQAQYFHDMKDEAAYQKGNVFMPVINNDGMSPPNATYKANLEALENLVLIKFAADTIVVPRISEWFGWVEETDQGFVEVPYYETALWKDDLIGLQTLNSTGRLHFLSTPGNHMQIDPQSLSDVIQAYLTN